MDAARPSCYHQDSALVLSQQVGTAEGVNLANRIGTVAGDRDGFRRLGQDLQQQRIGWVAGLDAG
jgi:hypothetical protein